MVLIPPFKLGGGNLRFIGTFEQTSETSLAQTSEVQESYIEDHSQPNTITASFAINNLKQAYLTLTARVRIFDLEQDVETILNGQSLDFSLNGKPFGGLFTASLLL